MPKTGSTAMQNAFFEFSEVFRTYGIHYFQSLRNHGNFLIPLFEPDRTKGAPARMMSWLSNEPEWYMETFLREVEQSPEDLFILSGENLAPMSEEGAGALFSFVTEHFDEVDVLAFLRPPVSLVHSSAQERIQNMGYGLSWFEKNSLRLPYRQNLEKWKRLAEDRFHSRVFAAGALDERCIVATLLNFLGAPPDCYRSIKVRRSNESLSLLAAELFCISNELFPPWVDNKANLKRAPRLSALLRKIQGPRFRAPMDFERRSLEHSRHEIAWVEDELALDLAEHDLDMPEDEHRLQVPMAPARQEELGEALRAINEELLQQP